METKKLFISFWVTLLVVTIPFIALGASPTSPSKTGVLKMGTSLPLSGPAAAWGNPISEVALIYADLLNKDGGITIGDTTYKINLIVSDDKFTPDGIKASADRLIYTEKVNAVVGGWIPPIAAILGRECTAANIPLIHIVRELPGLEVVSAKYPVMFDLGWPQLQCAQLNVPKLKSTVLPNIKTFALLSKDDTLGRTMLDIIKDLKQEWEKKYGLELIYDAVFPITAQDMTPWLSKIAALRKVDLINAVSATATNLAMIAKQSHELGLKCPIITVPSLTDVGEFIKIAGYDAAQFVYTSGCAPWEFPKTSTNYKDMSNRIRKVWKDKYAKDLTYGSAFEWCANQLAAYLSAAKIANSIKTEDIVRTLETKPIEHFYGSSIASGEKTYGIKRMLTYDVTVVKIVGGENKPVVSFGEPIP